MTDNVYIQTISADVKFSKFDINDFYEYFKDWQVENHMGLFGRPVKPVRHIQRQSIAEQMENMPEPPANPVIETTLEKPKKPVYGHTYEVPEYIRGKKVNDLKFMKAWVLSYYTELYDDLSIKIEDV